ALAAYLLGAIPSGVIAGRASRGIDIRDYGSGNSGFTNALRVLGLRWSLLVLVADLAKGTLPVLALKLFHPDPALEVIAAAGTLVGHVWPVWAGFRGGRGVATGFGTLLALDPVIALGAFVAGMAILLPFRYVSLMSVVGTPLAGAALIVAALLGYAPGIYAAYGVLAPAVIVLRHRENIGRLLRGTEPKLGQSFRRPERAGARAGKGG
ncbi:MAG TPA: glycerol-3-phosphate 1-O-acyltransferase PlsY, partial [Dehalococcoidia bacterium]